MEAADDWELRQMIEENEWKRKFACSKREAPGFEDEGDSGDQDKLKVGTRTCHFPLCVHMLTSRVWGLKSLGSRV